MMTTDPQDSSDHPRRWSLSEKRRIVELTQSKDASISAIALAHGIHPTSLSHWRSLYRAGKLSEGSTPEPSPETTARTGLLPIVVSSRRSPSAPALPNAVHSATSSRAHENNIIRVTFSSGATLRIETSSLDASVVCALLAELR